MKRKRKKFTLQAYESYYVARINQDSAVSTKSRTHTHLCHKAFKITQQGKNSLLSSGISICKMNQDTYTYHTKVNK